DALAQVGHGRSAVPDLSRTGAAVPLLHPSPARTGPCRGLTMKLGVRLESLGLSTRRALNEAARLRAAGVQADAAGAPAPRQRSPTSRRAACNLLRSLNLELTALGCPLRRGLDNPADLQPRIEHVRRVMSLSYDLGPRLAIVDMPAIPDEKPTPEPAPELSPGGLILGAAPRR